MSLAIWKELASDSKTPPQQRFTAWAIGTSIAVAGLTGKMIFENMLHRTVGKHLAKATVPLFVLSLAVSGGYAASAYIDPEKGTDRFTDSILDPFGTARITAALGVHAFQNNLVTPDIGTGGNIVSHQDIDLLDILRINSYLNLF